VQCLIFRTLRTGFSVLLVFLLWVPCGGLTGCAPAISRQFREQVRTPVDFKALLEDPESYKGEKVILGGYILETVNEPDRSLLMILQAPLDHQNKPKSQDLSEGRFLMQTEKFLDPEIYSKNRKLTVGGKVLGERLQPLGDRSYRYPVIDAEELHLWAKEVSYIRPLDPYYYYWHDPWCHYPYYPCPWWAW
jgi:outer membrane lipoprotein